MGNPQRTLVLASTSRYRRALLERLGLPFAVAAPDTDETPLPQETPGATALRLSEAKARAVAARHPDGLIIGSDQVADCDGRPIGKPGDRTRAVAQLRELSGRTVVFHTGVALLDARSGRCQRELVDIASTFRTLTDDEIGAYLDREQPYDCTGSVKAEALGIVLFDRIVSDDPSALIGLPLIALARLLRTEGVSPLFPRDLNGALMAGSLYLVPNLLGGVLPPDVLPARTIEVARTLRHWVVESPKPARAFIKSLDPPQPIATLDIRPLPPAADAKALSELLAPARDGADLGLLSDAGCPGIADPGASLVAAAHAAGIRVVPLVGPSSLLLALMASGMNGQSFAFHGYLPVPPPERAAALRRLEDESRTLRRAQLFIETPYRNEAMLQTIGETLRPATLVCVAVDLTLPTEAIERRTAAAWRREDTGRFSKRPALFVLDASGS